MPEGAITTGSPARIVPLAIVPAKPRKSRLGRLTHCTGIRNGRDWSSRSTSTVSRYPISVGPWYHGITSLRTSTFSPFSAEAGMQVIRSSPIWLANVR